MSASKLVGVVVQAWQVTALDAIASWLSEDQSKVEPRLLEAGATTRLITLLPTIAAPGEGDRLARLLDPFLRIMKTSKKVRACWSDVAEPMGGNVGFCFRRKNCGL